MSGALLLFALAAPPHVEALRTALESAEDPRVLLELSAGLSIDAAQLGPFASEVERLRAEGVRPAAIRVRLDHRELEATIDDPSGALDRISAVYVVNGAARPMAVLAGPPESRWRFEVPKEWPAVGTIELVARSTLVGREPLVRYVVSPALTMPRPPEGAPPAGAKIVEPAASPPWWVFAAGAAAAVAIGLGVAQEFR